MVKKLLITAVGVLGAYYVYRKVKAPVSAEEVLKGLEEELEKVLESVEEIEEEEVKPPKYSKDIYDGHKKVSIIYVRPEEIELTTGICSTPEAQEMINKFKSLNKDSMVGSE